jgi:hypothetical protein
VAGIPVFSQLAKNEKKSKEEQAELRKQVATKRVN